MASRFEDDDWTVVNYNRGRRRFRPVNYRQPPVPRWGSYPRRDGSRSYASAVRRGLRRDDEVDVYHQQRNSRSYGWRYNNRNAPRNVSGGDPRYWTGPQNLRIIHRLLKAVHHLQNVNQEKLPPSLDRITQNLATVIKPANPTRTTLTLIEGNAKYWAHNTTLILRDHYNDNIDEEVQRLSKFPIKDWAAPFDIASSWAKRNLGPRLKQETLDHAHAVIVAKLADLTTESAATDAPATVPAASAAAAAAPPQDEVPAAGQPRPTQDAATAVLLDVQPLLTEARRSASTAAASQRTTDTIQVRAEIHPPPRDATPSYNSVGVMTEPPKDDWLLDFTLYQPSPEGPPEVSQLSPSLGSLLKLKDLPKHTKEKRKTPLVREPATPGLLHLLVTSVRSCWTSHQQSPVPPPLLLERTHLRPVMHLAERPWLN
ncbi:uncharacterized protein LOC110014552 [Oryzias latipes]|uniref:uncharacterized protein LOC110014552 n=1 Tax=Oryzias latipes TaxID=8090 RepID=UPI000CE1CB9C|nr:uncharacterized protein LOC110014552 [Oryzias latipes]